MNAEIKAKWVDALRSGKYRQGTGKLRSDNGSFCCLGVLCEVVGIPISDDGMFCGPRGYRQIAKIVGNDYQRLFVKNDYGASFSDIADDIEANL